MTLVAAPPRPPRTDDPEALFEEARRHRRARWLKLAAAAALVVAAGTVAYAVLGADTNEPATTQVFKNGVLTTVRTQTVVLLVDVSGSMRATDIQPTRLGATIVATKTFLERLPDRVEVGLVAFSTTPTVVQAPTRDRGLVTRALDSLRPEAGTGLGDGLTEAVRLTVASLARQGIRRAPGHDLPAVIILESDGAQNRGAIKPLQAALRAKAEGIRVEGVSLGTLNGKFVFRAGFYATTVKVPPDPKTVAQIAQVTGGNTFSALTAARLEAIYRDLASSIGH